MRRLTTVAILVALVTVTTACDGNPFAGGGGDGPRFVAEVATYQVVVDEPTRFTVGLIGASGRWVSFGNATLTFIPPDDVDAEALAPVVAGFLPLPGSPDPEADPTLTLASEGRGVYAAQEVTFGHPGFWRVDASVELDGRTETASAAFQVLPEPIVPTVGEAAPSVDHPTLDDEVDPAILDSRARDGEPLPDPELHELSIADALAAEEPALIVFSTPVYCTSRFCGPITDMVAELAAEYGDRASFVHVEVWSDFEGRELNPAADEWIGTDDDRVLEPWVFLVDADGTIIGSWDNIATRGELASALEALPAP